ncbi:hypothetical protein KJ059_19385 [Myxococcota bacterium]|nr:hypothetical protein [Myxococcota bacterium]
MLRRWLRRFRRRPPPPDATLHGWHLGGHVDPPRPPEPSGWQRVERPPEAWRRRAEQARIERQRERARDWWGPRA